MAIKKIFDPNITDNLLEEFHNEVNFKLVINAFIIKASKYSSTYGCCLITSSSIYSNRICFKLNTFFSFASIKKKYLI